MNGLNKMRPLSSVGRHIPSSFPSLSPSPSITYSSFINCTKRATSNSTTVTYSCINQPCFIISNNVIARRGITTSSECISAGRPIVAGILPPPWELPAQALSAKRLSASDSLDVSAQLTAFDPNIPIEHAHMPPSSWYISDSFMRAEMGGIFSKSWQFACRSDQVAKPGQYVATYAANGEPVLITRSADGDLRAFANVCRHHAARVADGCGVASQFTCPYHNWTYNDQGRLTKATRMTGIKDFSAAKTKLTSLGVEQWGPLVFVNHAPLYDDSSNSNSNRNSNSNNHPMFNSVNDQLSSVTKDMDALLPLGKSWNEGGWEKLHHLNRRVYHINCNWKVYCDNYLDGGYHIEHLHKGLFSELDMPTYRTDLYDSVSIQRVRSKSERVGSDAVYGFMFPNLAINRYGDWLDTNLVVPVSPDKCVIVFDWYHTGASPTHDKEHNKDLFDGLDQSRSIQDEDVSISESVQCGIGSSSYEKGRYAPSVEIAELHFHRLIHSALSNHIKTNPLPPSK